jgi:hypothetical protein
MDCPGRIGFLLNPSCGLRRFTSFSRSTSTLSLAFLAIARVIIRLKTSNFLLQRYFGKRRTSYRGAKNLIWQNYTSPTRQDWSIMIWWDLTSGSVVINPSIPRKMSQDWQTESRSGTKRWMSLACLCHCVARWYELNSQGDTVQNYLLTAQTPILHPNRRNGP